MDYKHLRAAEYRLMPWKNGRGTTCEVWREPDDDAEAFIWRVSIADIKEKSLFSKFSGLTRVIGTLEGEGMRLKVDGAWTGPLRPYDLFVFNGDSEVESELLDGPIRDFNLIYNPLVCSARLQWLDLGRPRVFCSQAATLLIFAVGQVEVGTGELSINLDHHDSALLDNDQAVLTRISLTPRAKGSENHCCLIEINGR